MACDTVGAVQELTPRLRWPNLGVDLGLGNGAESCQKCQIHQPFSTCGHKFPLWVESAEVKRLLVLLFQKVHAEPAALV